MSERVTGKIVRHKMDLFTPKELTPEIEAQLKRLDEMKDEDIDFSDAPRTTDFSRFRRYPDFRVEITRRLNESAEREAKTEQIGIEADVLEFFRESGDASPKRINAALREYVVAHRKIA